MPGSEAQDFHGLRRLLVPAEKVLDGSWRDRAAGVDLVVVPDPPRDKWPALAAAGFRLKPSWVTWGRETPRREEDFLAGLPKGERYNLRQAQRYVAEQALAVEVVDAPDVAVFTEFLAVYDAQIATMPYGIPAAHAVPPTQAALSDYFLVTARRDGELLAGVMAKLSAREDAVRIAFSAVRPERRGQMITRALYLRVFAEARRRGVRWLSLGTDPTLYGHIAQAGLLAFKSRLGFVPVPLHHLDPEDDGGDEAELVLSTARLRHPAMSLCYAEPPRRLATWADPLPFRLDVLSGADGLDLRPFRAPFITEIAPAPVPDVTARATAAGSELAERPVVAIVDPLSTGVWLAPEFRRRGWDCVAVLSGTASPSYTAALRRDDFVAVFDCSPGGPEDRARVTAQLAALAPRHVIPGCEWGVNLADDLAVELATGSENVDLPGRPRRRKDAMLRAVARAGLRVPVSRPVADAAELDQALLEIDSWPVVIKPTSSAGSDGVHICGDAEEAHAVLEKLLGGTNALGERNETLLAQECLTGQQYFVNSVSVDGRHYIHEIWRDDRLFVHGRPLYDRQVLLEPTGPVQRQLADYVTGVLDALGVRNGPAHTELFVDRRGPVLVECGARLEGAVDPRPVELATGDSQVSLTVERYVDPDRFRRRPGKPYVCRRRLAVVCLVAPHDGVIDGERLAELADLPSVYGGTALRLPHGAPVQATVDLFTSPGHVYLVADTLEELDRDYARIRHLEANGLYGRISPVAQGLRS